MHAGGRRRLCFFLPGRASRAHRATIPSHRAAGVQSDPGSTRRRAVVDRDRTPEESLRVYEQAFRKIKDSTGIEDLTKLVDRFIEVEDQNFSLYNFVNELNRETETLREQVCWSAGVCLCVDVSVRVRVCLCLWVSQARSRNACGILTYLSVNLSCSLFVADPIAAAADCAGRLGERVGRRTAQGQAAGARGPPRDVAGRGLGV